MFSMNGAWHAKRHIWKSFLYFLPFSMPVTIHAKHRISIKSMVLDSCTKTIWKYQKTNFLKSQVWHAGMQTNKNAKRPISARSAWLQLFSSIDFCINWLIWISQNLLDYLFLPHFITLTCLFSMNCIPFMVCIIWMNIFKENPYNKRKLWVGRWLDQMKIGLTQPSS